MEPPLVIVTPSKVTVTPLTSMFKPSGNDTPEKIWAPETCKLAVPGIDPPTIDPPPLIIRLPAKVSVDDSRICPLLAMVHPVGKTNDSVTVKTAPLGTFKLQLVVPENCIVLTVTAPVMVTSLSISTSSIESTVWEFANCKGPENLSIRLQCFSAQTSMDVEAVRA
jgi:hypothetical protein